LAAVAAAAPAARAPQPLAPPAPLAPAHSGDVTLFELLASARLARFVGTLLDLGAQAVEDVAELSTEELTEVVGMDEAEVRRLGAALERWRGREPLGTGALEAGAEGGAAEDDEL
jgi:hypothetical protein